MIGPISLGGSFLTVCDFGTAPTAPGVKLMNSAGGTAVARSTAGIITIDTNIRAKLITPPSLPDWYVPEWDDNLGTPIPDEVVWVNQILTNILTAATIAGGGGLTPAPIVLPAGGVSPVVTQTFYIKRGDTEPLIYQVTELDSAGVPHVVDVTGWTGNFKMRGAPDVGTATINHPFYLSDFNGNVVTDGSDGLIAYAWPNPGETDREGLYVAEFETHRPSGEKKTYPTTTDLTNEYIKVYFVADLDDAGGH